METAKFEPGQTVFVNRTPKESAFAGWLGIVQETRRSKIGGGLLFVSVDFNHAVYGRFNDAVFLEDELKTYEDKTI